MIITLGDARRALAEYVGKAGKCPEDPQTKLFVQTVVQRLLHRGAHGNMRKWSFCLCNGCFTAPDDLEIPVKVKLGGQASKVWSKWYEFFDTSPNDNTCNWSTGLYEEPNTFFTIYDLPQGGARIAAIPFSSEASDAYITIQGLDQNGRDVFTKSQGVQIHGEKLPISREDPKFTRTTFSRITGIQKSETNHYVRLYWQTVCGSSAVASNRGLLAEYKPTDVFPSYRRFKVPEARCDCCLNVTVLGRVKDPTFSHDNDILPVTSLPSLVMMAQVARAERTDNLEAASYKRQVSDQLIDDENQYRRTGEEPFDIFFENSPGAIENLI